MRKKVSRVEAAIIMRNAREFRERANQQVAAVEPEVVVVPVEKPVEAPKKSLFAYVIDFFRKKGT